MLPEAGLTPGPVWEPSAPSLQKPGAGGSLLRAPLLRWAPMLQRLSPEGRRVKRVCEGCVGSDTMLAASRVQRVVEMSTGGVGETR